MGFDRSCKSFSIPRGRPAPARGLQRRRIDSVARDGYILISGIGC
jgi:hypothetical protein